MSNVYDQLTISANDIELYLQVFIVVALPYLQTTPTNDMVLVLLLLLLMLFRFRAAKLIDNVKFQDYKKHPPKNPFT